MILWEAEVYVPGRTPIHSLQESPQLVNMESSFLMVLRSRVETVQAGIAAWQPRPLPAEWRPRPRRTA